MYGGGVKKNNNKGSLYTIFLSWAQSAANFTNIHAHVLQAHIKHKHIQDNNTMGHVV